MKTVTYMIVAAALVLPSTASAQRWATPGTHDRHEANLKSGSGTVEMSQQERSSDRRADNAARSTGHITGAKAGKINLAKESAGDGA